MVTAHHFRLPSPLPLLGALAWSSGFIDALVYLRVAQTFVANMSGNVILFGVGLGEGGTSRAAAPAVAIVAFCSGLVLAIVLEFRRRQDNLTPRPALLLTAELGLLAVLAVAMHRVGTPTSEVSTWALIAIGGVAMGLQTPVLRRVYGITVSTTFTSGAVAQLAEASTLRRLEHDPDRSLRERRRALVMGTGVGAYAAGAATAGLMNDVGPVGFAAPMLVLAACAFRLRRPAPDDPAGIPGPEAEASS